MAVFLLIIGGCLLALLAWVLYSRRGPRPEKRARAEDKVYALNTQIRSVEPPEHTTGVAFGVLLKAARGDRAAVEKWIVAEQYRGSVPVSREEAIELLARRLLLSRN
ncbi:MULTISPECIES: hypothetical protein [Chromobacterium]|uniref:Uncharacterized protein n=1 Tax=Chromobacterium aquaticum TaxID=467180 RepID=A0ABV8ZUX6_9NEIS|nr:MULTISPECIES: hypothetical protein [Chromobacterium]KMN37546.1 hypothetical protein VI26_03360 [Chromobacterium sp. LK1]MCD5361965.1 hypothetical protein [Chromobacterium aquaticum]RBH51757.1 hypothetical protein C3F00_033295 [Pseudomonas sp. MWU13-2860]